MKQLKLEKFENILDVKFKDLTLVEKSLTHKSYNSKNNYEKLEFLGDRVLALVISKKLLEIYPKESEGIIDKKFSNLVNRKTCASIAKKLNLRKYMFLGESFKNLKRSDDKILSDCLEAVIGAIYLELGYNTTEKFIIKNWEIYLKSSKTTVIDSKTTLQEYSLKKFKLLPKYKLQKISGPHHNPNFKATVQIKMSKKYIGFGNSKKIAQQNAAKNLLYDMKII